MISLDKSNADKSSKPKRYTLDDIFFVSSFDESKGLIFLMDYIRDKYEISAYVNNTYVRSEKEHKPALIFEFVLEDETCKVQLVYVKFEYFELTLHKSSTVESLRGWYATKHLYFRIGEYEDKESFLKLLECIDNIENEFKLLETT